MDSHPKKKKVQSKSEIKPRSRRWQRSIQSILYTKQKQTKPHYPTLQYRGVYRKKKKKNQIQSKKETKYRANQTPDLEQTKPTVARSSLHDLRHSSSSSSRRHSLASRRRSSLARRRRSQIGLTVSTAPVLGLKVFLSLFLSDSLSLSHSLTH